MHTETIETPAGPLRSFLAASARLTAVTRCEAVYDKQQTFAGGAPVVRSVKCGPGGP